VVAEIGSDYKYGFHTPDAAEASFFKPAPGLSPEPVAASPEHKNAPDWMRKFRLKSLECFMARPLPTWGGDVTGIDFDNIFYYIRPTEKQAKSGEDLTLYYKNPWTQL